MASVQQFGYLIAFTEHKKPATCPPTPGRAVSFWVSRGQRCFLHHNGPASIKPPTHRAWSGRLPRHFKSHSISERRQPASVCKQRAPIPGLLHLSQASRRVTGLRSTSHPKMFSANTKDPAKLFCFQCIERSFRNSNSTG